MRKKLSSYLIIFLLLVAYTGSSLGFEIELKKGKTENVDEQSTARSTHAEKITISHFNAIFQPAHLIFQSAFSFETEFPVESDGNEHAVIETALIFIKYYKTLLSRIIVPNAP